MKRIIASLFLSGLFALTGCVGLTSSATQTTAQAIVAKTISAMNQVKSFTLDTDVINNYNVIYNIGVPANITEWNGIRNVDVSNQAIGMSMTMTYCSSGTSDKIYLEDGIEYLKTVSDANIPPSLGWVKYELGNSENAEWNREAQISNLIELLKKSTQFSSLQSEKVDDVDCYIFLINPTRESVVDWVLSQDQSNGPSLNISHGGSALVGGAFLKAYRSSTIKVWIAKDSYLVMQVDLSSHFETSTEELGRSLHSPIQNLLSYFHEIFVGKHEISSDFHGQMNFSNYNQPVSIQVPQEALDAKEY
jgi:metal-sulfur cluster biosynthetic enzyme